MASELHDAERLGQRAWISASSPRSPPTETLILVFVVGHMPFGKVDALRDQSNYAGQIFERYHRTIAAHFYGHRCAGGHPAPDVFLMLSLTAMLTSLRSHTRTITTSVRRRRTASPSSLELSRLAVRGCAHATSKSTNDVPQVGTLSSGCTMSIPTRTKSSTLCPGTVRSFVVRSFGSKLTLFAANKTEPSFDIDPVWQPYYSARASYGDYIDPPLGPLDSLNATFWHRITEVMEKDE